MSAKLPAAVELGRLGGAAGVGDAKRRPRQQYVRMADWRRLVAFAERLVADASSSLEAPGRFGVWYGPKAFTISVRDQVRKTSWLIERDEEHPWMAVSLAVWKLTARARWGEQYVEKFAAAIKEPD